MGINRTGRPSGSGQHSFRTQDFLLFVLLLLGCFVSYRALHLVALFYRIVAYGSTCTCRRDIPASFSFLLFLMFITGNRLQFNGIPGAPDRRKYFGPSRMPFHVQPWMVWKEVGSKSVGSEHHGRDDPVFDGTTLWHQFRQ